jgi:hypothetical protein
MSVRFHPWRLRFRQSSFHHIARVLQGAILHAFRWPLLLRHALVPSSFRLQVNRMTQKLPFELLLTASGIQHRVPRRTLSPHPALQSRRWYDDSTNPFPCGTTVASRAKPSSMPPVVTGAVLSSLLLLLAVLHHVQAITARRWATTPPVPSFPHTGIVASSCEARWCRTSQVP